MHKNLLLWGSAIALVERLLERGGLTRAQEIVFRYTWEEKTYLEMAREQNSPHADRCPDASAGKGL